ncbi:hypothetical protein BCM02_110240 [Paenibacillus methanolicus]|uniref:Uncharacterized protein n=1 Tax=Paenibacillus methanolicus TaxID=582686 RepID=A0A5S5BWD0_9BACL|nr:hypothetical protein BCM02_110240 [Paenibacillus methanolicus]
MKDKKTKQGKETDLPYSGDLRTTAKMKKLPFA